MTSFSAPSSPITATPPSPSRPPTAFISGPIVPSPAYFSTHYAPRIQRAIAAHHSFVLGPAPGIDSQALSYLLSQGVPKERITVYLTQYEARSPEMREGADAADVRIEVAGITTAERDAAMTANSDYDILRYRTPEEEKRLYGKWYTPGRVSATERNERRRRALSVGVEGEAGRVLEVGEEKEAERKQKRKSKLWERLRGKLN